MAYYLGQTRQLNLQRSSTKEKLRALDEQNRIYCLSNVYSNLKRTSLAAFVEVDLPGLSSLFSEFLLFPYSAIVRPNTRRFLITHANGTFPCREG